MAELKEVLSELIDKTKSGELKWQVNFDEPVWTVEHDDCVFWIAENSLDVVWKFYNHPTKRTRVEIGSAENIKPLTDLLHQMYPFIVPVEPTTDDALQAALDCLTK